MLVLAGCPLGEPGAPVGAFLVVDAPPELRAYVTSVRLEAFGGGDGFAEMRGASTHEIGRSCRWPVPVGLSPRGNDEAARWGLLIELLDDDHCRAFPEDEAVTISIKRPRSLVWLVVSR